MDLTMASGIVDVGGSLVKLSTSNKVAVNGGNKTK